MQEVYFYGTRCTRCRPWRQLVEESGAHFYIRASLLKNETTLFLVILIVPQENISADLLALRQIRLGCREEQ